MAEDKMEGGASPLPVESAKKPIVIDEGPFIITERAVIAGAVLEVGTKVGNGTLYPMTGRRGSYMLTPEEWEQRQINSSAVPLFTATPGASQDQKMKLISGR